MRNRTFVLGAKGMLGRYVHSYLKRSEPVTRKQLNVLDTQGLHNQLDWLNIKQGDVVINCIGITNKRVCPDSDFLIANSLFPRILADYCEEVGANMIHITTDCVYTGKDGNYNEDSVKNEVSIYGLSKSLGEPQNCTVIRTSIIGETTNNCSDLLEWVRSHENTTITGYTNHFWNGITCLQFAKICEKIISEYFFFHGTRHVFSPDSVSKAQLVSIINDVYKLGNRIVEKDAIFCDRTLSSKYPLLFDIPSIYDQIVEQKNYKL